MIYSKLQDSIDSDILRIVNRVDLSDLKNSSLFLTGGTGFVGFWLLSLLKILNSLNYNISVTVLSRTPSRFLEKAPQFKNLPWLNFLAGDLETYNIPETPFNYIIHAATDTSEEASARELSLFRGMINSSIKVLEHARLSKVKRILLVSSGAVYGESLKDKERIREDAVISHHLSITNIYGDGKKVMELLGQLYFKEYELDVLFARCFAFSGYGLTKHLVLNQLMNQALKGEPLTINGSGNLIRSYLYAADLALWLLAILIKGERNNAYNVGSDESFTLLQIAKLIRDIFSPNCEIRVAGNAETTSRLIYVPSVEKSKSLGLNVWHTLEQSLKLWHDQMRLCQY